MRMKKLTSKKHFVILIICLAVLLAVTAFWIIKTRRDNTLLNDKNTAQTTSTAPSAQSSFTGNDTSKQDHSSVDKPSVKITDNSGTLSSIPASQYWSKSSDGSSIIVYTPSQNEALNKSVTISGQATSKQVSYRVIDNVTGLISSGNINVIDGKFSASLTFSTTATEGRVDVFNQSDYGKETNDVSVPVRFD